MPLDLDILLTVNEGSTPKITASLTDEAGVAVPDAQIQSVTVAVHDYISGEELRAATAATPSGGIVTTWLTKEETRIIDTTLEYEHRVITVVAQYATTRYATAQAFIKVNNLRQHSVPEPEA